MYCASERKETLRNTSLYTNIYRSIVQKEKKATEMKQMHYDDTQFDPNDGVHCIYVDVYSSGL